MATVLSWPESNSAFLGHTRTTHFTRLWALFIVRYVEIAVIEKWNITSRKPIDNVIGPIKNRCAAFLAIRKKPQAIVNILHHL